MQKSIQIVDSLPRHPTGTLSHGHKYQRPESSTHIPADSCPDGVIERRRLDIESLCNLCTSSSIRASRNSRQNGYEADRYRDQPFVARRPVEWVLFVIRAIPGVYSFAIGKLVSRYYGVLNPGLVRIAGSILVVDCTLSVYVSG